MVDTSTPAASPTMSPEEGWGVDSDIPLDTVR